MHSKLRHIFIVYDPGYAGNFLARLFSLSAGVVPLLPKSLLFDWSETTVKPTLDLLELYKFDTVHKDHGNDWIKFHDSWTSIYDHELYDSLIDLGEPYDSIVYQIHPVEFANMESYIKSISDKQLFYVELSLEKNGQWVNDARNRLHCYIRGSEHELGLRLKQQYNMNVISLDNILADDEHFLEEYSNAVCSMNLSNESLQALELYHNWKKYRA